MLGLITYRYATGTFSSRGIEKHTYEQVVVRLRGVDVVTATEERTNAMADDALLNLAGEQGRVIFTHDIRFKALAENWQRIGKPFAGLISGHAEGASIGQYVRDLELVAKTCEPSELSNTVIHLPL